MALKYAHTDLSTCKYVCLYQDNENLAVKSLSHENRKTEDLFAQNDLTNKIPAKN